MELHASVWKTTMMFPLVMCAYTVRQKFLTVLIAFITPPTMRQIQNQEPNSLDVIHVKKDTIEMEYSVFSVPLNVSHAQDLLLQNAVRASMIKIKF